MKLKKDNYMLSFSAKGVSVFVTDIHVDVYKDLEVIFLIDDGLFKQYFTNKAFEDALDRGLQFYSDKTEFTKYKSDLDDHCEVLRHFYNSEIKGKSELSKQVVETFFKYTTKLCKDYTLMNFEHTDKAFSKQDENPVIKDNLDKASKYKDVVREYMNQVLFEDDGYISEVFKILGSQFDLDPNTIHGLTQEEVLELFDSVMPDTDKIKIRQQAFVINFDREILLEGEDAQEVLMEFRDNSSDESSVTGKTASLGKVKGKVKVINVDYTDLKLLNEEISKMADGDILVAETTAPELIVACKKAAAIVTDIGGLLSHAAIVSREFGIPCIVGTETATKVFKDGDKVEVNAEKRGVGIVKKSL